MTSSLQKMGSIAALYEAAAYIVGIVFFILVVDFTAVTNPTQKVILLSDNQASIYIMNLVIYVIFGVFLVILALALHERLKTGSPVIMQTATALGLIWAGLVIAGGMIFNIGTGVVVNLYNTDPAQAATVWVAIEAVCNGIGGGNEFVGGAWLLLVSWAALQARELFRPLNYLGLVVGVAGILSAVPALGELGGLIFGLGQIVWFVWLGVVMMRHSPRAA